MDAGRKPIGDHVPGVTAIAMALNVRVIAQLRAQATLVQEYESRRWQRQPATAADIEQYLREQHDQESDDFIFADIGAVVRAEPRALDRLAIVTSFRVDNASGR